MKIKSDFAILIALVISVLPGVLLIAAMMLTGATFGQRCEAKGFTKWSDEWDACIERLRKSL